MSSVLNPNAFILSGNFLTEKHIEKGMDAIMRDRTTFVIAHRLSTVRDADKIMVLEKGEIIEKGTHIELLEKKGRYYEGNNRNGKRQAT